MSQNFQYITYGSTCTSTEVEQFLRHLLQSAFVPPTNPSEPPTPICIWGRHGVGKTQLVEELAGHMGAQFRYIAPAQFEEMGDLLGMPRINTETGQTELVPPAWVPKTEGPGVFLIDDVNRADDRILRGIMQLLQYYELASWRLPARWQIVLTANPDGGDYSVTTMDDALLTRMLHVTMRFDVQSWARWAEGAGIDPRGIAFVLTYPELVTGRRTTPRSLTQFFRQTQSIANLNEQIVLVKMLADACLDEETATAFISFVKLQLHQLITPDEILNAKAFETIHRRLETLLDGPTKRLDLLSVITTRLVNYLTISKPTLTNPQIDNLRQFILLELIPNDMRLFLAQELIASGNSSLKRLMAVPEIGKLILTKM